MAASTKAPEQIETMRAPRAAARRSADTSVGGIGRATSSMPGTTTVSASRSVARPARGRIVKACAATSRAVPQTRTT